MTNIHDRAEETVQPDVRTAEAAADQGAATPRWIPLVDDLDDLDYEMSYIEIGQED